MNDTVPRLLADFNVVEVLGKGAYGVVLHVVNCLDIRGYAIKVVGGDIEQALREVKNLVQIPDHPNVVKYYTCWKDTFSQIQLAGLKKDFNVNPVDLNPYGHIFGDELQKKFLCIQMELCGEDLRTWLYKQTKVDEKKVMTYFIQICKGLDHIHRHGIIHRDLKPDNIFLGKTDPPVVKIGDLGIATVHHGNHSLDHTDNMGTPLYLAPEQATTRYGMPADVYALGIIFVELLCPQLQPAFNSGSLGPLVKAITDLKFQGILPGDIESRWPKAATLILKMLKVNPQQRPTFKEILDTFRVSK